MKLNKFILSIGLLTAVSAPIIASDATIGTSQEPKEEQTSGGKMSYEEFRRRAKKRYKNDREESVKKYLAFRDSILTEFVQQMKRPWKEEKSKEAAPKPIDESIEPEIIPEDEVIDYNAPEEEVVAPPVVDVPKEEPAPVVKEEPKVQPKEEPAPVVKEEPKVQPKEEPAPVVKEEPKVEPKEEPAPVVKEEPKVEPKEEPAPVVKEEPKKSKKEQKKDKKKEKEKKKKDKKDSKKDNDSSSSISIPTPSVTVPSTPSVPSVPKTEPKKETAPEKEQPKTEPKEEPKEEPAPVVKEEPKEEPAPVVKEEPKPVVEEKKPKRNAPKANIIKREPQEVKISKAITLPDMSKHVRPTPFVPVIKEEKNTPETFGFTFYGTDIEVKIDERCKFKIASIDNNGIAEAMEKVTKNDYLPTTLSNCLDIRKEYKLCDWAYLQMLQELSNSFFGGKCNEATLLTGYLYCMSGYKMRFAYNTKKELIILFASDQYITSLPFVSIASDGYRSYYSLTPDQAQLYICDYAFPQEKAMSLYINEIPEFESDTKNFDMTLHTSRDKHSYKVNKNLVDFFDKYPTPMTENDTYSKWSYYALTPLSPEAKATAYPSIKKLIDGKTDIAAVNVIMDWVETYKYGYDSEVWGYDRAFFPDETLWYPMSDCEDHAILFARLVNDLLGLETALIYYPGHLAAAVKFNDEVRGDYLLHNGQKYTVCDPTYYYCKAGTTMRSCRGKQATLILLNNGKK